MKNEITDSVIVNTDHLPELCGHARRRRWGGQIVKTMKKQTRAMGPRMRVKAKAP